MMTGYLASQGLKASEVRIGTALKNTHHLYHEDRQKGLRRMNPIPYYAEYFGHKLHMDQNEKIGMFGVTHVLAIDGYSSKVVGGASMPVKNNVVIYDKVYRAAVLKYGLWDQVRVDHGREFFLTLYMQQKLADLRYNRSRQPYLQTQSKRNHRIERIWPEVNQRLNYPLKAGLVELVDSDAVNLEDDLEKHCISSLVLSLVEPALAQLISSWNAHRIPGRGIPNNLTAHSKAVPLAEEQLPSGIVAADMYKQDKGRLTLYPVFGCSPFESSDQQAMCENAFMEDYPDISGLLTSALHGDYWPLKGAVVKLIDLARRMT